MSSISRRRSRSLLAVSAVLIVVSSVCLGDEVARKVPSGFRAVFEYSLELHTLNLKENRSKRREGENPFTGERLVFVAFEGMSTSEVNALLKVLTEHEASVGDDEGSRSVVLTNGTRFSVRGLGRRPKAGIQVLQMDILTRAKFSESEALFVRQIALAGNLALCSPTNPDVVATLKPVASKEFKDRFKKTMVLAKLSELASWMQKEIGGRSAIDPISFAGE